MGRVFGQNNVASELPRSEPEGKVWNFVELKFCMNSAEGNIATDYPDFQPDFYNLYALFYPSSNARKLLT